MQKKKKTDFCISIFLSLFLRVVGSKAVKEEEER